MRVASLSRRITQDSLRAALVGGVVLGLAAQAPAQAQGCRAGASGSPGECSHPNAGLVVSRPVQPNVSEGPAPDLGEIGFSISIDGLTAEEGAARQTLAGAPARPEPRREIDRLLAIAGVDLTYDGLGARPRLAVATIDMRETFVAGEAVTFRAASNYPGWIARAEVVIADHRGREVARLPIPANGTASWIMPHDGEGNEYTYFLRASDLGGRRDETRSLVLRRSATALAPELTGPVVAAGEGEDMTRRRGIPVRGGAITVSGQSTDGQPVTVLGEQVAVDAAGRFVVQRILPPGIHAVAISVDGRRMDRSVRIENSEWFATGILDLTIGRSAGETWRLGRVAGFAQGTLADGTRITAAVDTEEAELRDLFRNFGTKRPDQTLRMMRAQDVFVTFGDDSQISELAPTSGKLFLRVERDGSHLQWGDFKPRESTGLSVRTDRALYGLSAVYSSPAVTAEGEARVRVSGFAAQADSLMQRDVMRATSGSAYFLSRRDILPDSETVMVQIVSRTTGLVVETRRLTEGRDYRVNAVQGIILLNAPLSATVAGDGLVTNNPLGDHDVNLVAQYEYVPTAGNVDGYTAGIRGEFWAGNGLRFGASLLRETTGIADNTLSGVDILLKRGDSAELLLEYAISEGPGFGSSFSLNGGLDLEPFNPSYGLPGQKAASWRIAGRTDLGFAGLEGEVAGFLDRKEAGFTSPDRDFQFGQRSAGLSGRIALSSETALTFGGEAMHRDDGHREETARLGFVHQLSPAWRIEGEIAHDRRDQRGAPLDFGRRLDAAVRLTWSRDEDLALWVLGQGTLSRDATRSANNRLGLGARMRLGARTELVAEVSGGSLGAAGLLEFGYRPNETTDVTIGYRLDPLRRLDADTFSGRDRGSLVFGVTSRVNDRLSYTAENSYSAFGTRPSLASGYGVSYTPSLRWRYDGMIQQGRSREADGSRLERRAVSFGLRYTDGDAVSAGLRGEWRRENSDRPNNALDRRTWLLSGFYESRVSEDWRFVSALDLVYSESDQTAFRDGRYVEAKLGYAWRPVGNDDLNALFSYTYLYDMPGADQVNIDGQLNGDRQRSHILNAALSWQIDPQWTLGAKYGYRMRSSAARASTIFVTSEAHLAVLRADFHIVHNWDILAEVRAFYSPGANTTEKAVLVGVNRAFGGNLRLGLGYLNGRVSDDLRSIKMPKSGLFLNLTTQF